MTLNEFHEELINDIAARREFEGGFSESVFTAYAAESLEAAGVIDNFSLCRFRDAKGTYGFDGYSFDEVDDTLTVCISEWVGSPNSKTLTPKDARATFSKLRAFLEAVAKGTFQNFIDTGDAAYDFALTMTERLSGIRKVRALLLTDGTLSQKVKDWPEGVLAGIPIEFYIWDIARFYKAFESQSGLDEIEVSFTHLPDGGLPCLHASLSGASYQGYLAVLPASELARIYEQYGSRLLEGNVRAFLSNKGKVNQGIRRTLLSSPSMFFAYNNGISCVASKVSLRQSMQSTKITSITNLQIVNGGQTTASIFAADRDDHAQTLADTFVPMKLSIVEGDDFSSLMKDISLFANSQNKVSDADLASNDPFQIRFEEMSRRILAPAVRGLQYNTRWYYERARGQYANEFYKLPQKQKESQQLIYPKTQLFTKLDLARVVLCWSKLPHIVALGSQRMINEFSKLLREGWDRDKTQFNDQYYRDRVAELIVYKHFDAAIAKQDWYIVGYKAIIASYAIAWLAARLEKDKRCVELDSIWRNQTIGEPLRDTLLEIGKNVFSHLFLPQDGKAPNVTQLAKRQGTWVDVQQLAIDLDLTRIPVMTYGEKRDIISQARASRAVDDGIEAQMIAVAKGKEHWKRVKQFLEGRGTLAHLDQIALAVAESGDAPPNEKQALRLLSLDGLANRNGFIEQ